MYLPAKGFRPSESRDEEKIINLSNSVYDWMQLHSDPDYFLGVVDRSKNELTFDAGRDGVVFDPYENGDVMGVGCMVKDHRLELLERYTREITGEEFVQGKTGLFSFFRDMQMPQQLKSMRPGSGLAQETVKLAESQEELDLLISMFKIGNKASEDAQTYVGFQIHEYDTVIPFKGNHYPNMAVIYRDVTNSQGEPEIH